MKVSTGWIIGRHCPLAVMGIENSNINGIGVYFEYVGWGLKADGNRNRKPNIYIPFLPIFFRILSHTNTTIEIIFLQTNPRSRTSPIPALYSFHYISNISSITLLPLSFTSHSTTLLFAIRYKTWESLTSHLSSSSW